MSITEHNSGRLRIFDRFRGNGRSRRINHIDDQLAEHWLLGRNVIIAWAIADESLLILKSRFDLLSRFINASAERSGTVSHIKREEFLSCLLAGTRMVAESEIYWLARILEAEVHSMVLPEARSLTRLDVEQIERCVCRYGMNFKRERAVALVDIVDFSLHEPITQVALIHSLSLSLNWAERQIEALGFSGRVARSTTGDGFYVWIRDDRADSMVDLYLFILLALANNAIQASGASPASAPRLKAAFHVGDYYDLYPSQRLRPDYESMIVGHVTVELARVLEQAQPGQILLGDFLTGAFGPGSSARRSVDTLAFVDHLQHIVDRVLPLDIDGQAVGSIRCYATGRRRRDGRFDVSVYRITDKHGKQRSVFNAKVNVELDGGRSLFLGLRDLEVNLQRAGHVRGGPR